MTSVGMIHMACYCGADLYYVGNNGGDQSPAKIIEQLKSKMGPGNIGFFSSADGECGECPYCGLYYELPDPEILDWLPFMDKENFTSAVTEMQRSGGKQTGQKMETNYTGRYLS